MLVTVIVVTYHRAAFLRSTIDSIYAQEDVPGPIELIVIDNGGGDARVPPCPRNDFPVRVVTCGRNLGVAGGRNLGIQLARGGFLIFIDDDAIWHDPHDMARLIARLANNPRCGCVAVKVINAHTGQVDRALLPAPNKARLLRGDTPQETPYFYGCAYAARAYAISVAGLYPERLVYGMEELDLSLRLAQHGYTIVFDPAVAVLHYSARSGREYVGARYWKQQALNKSRVAWRHLPMPYPITIGLIWSAAVLIKTRQPRVVAEIWRTLWGERRLLRAERRVISPQALRYLRGVGARLLY